MDLYGSQTSGKHEQEGVSRQVEGLLEAKLLRWFEHHRLRNASHPGARNR